MTNLNFKLKKPKWSKSLNSVLKMKDIDLSVHRFEEDIAGTDSSLNDLVIDQINKFHLYH